MGRVATAGYERGSDPASSMSAIIRLGLPVLLFGGCRASDQGLGDWWLSWDEATGALSVEHRGRRLLDLLADWGLSEAQREAVLVTNPARVV